MGINVTTPNNGSDYVEFKNAAGTSLAKVGGYDDGSSNGHLELYTTASGTSTERMRIDSAGNVGIGTSSPTLNLQVKAATPIIGAESSSWTTGASAELRLSYVATDARAIKGHYDNGMTFHVNGERMRIDSSGNLLVGTTSATHSGTTSKCILKSSDNVLGVVTDSGNTQAVRFTNGTTAVGSINLTTSATSYSTSSDYRLKENIQPMQNALGVVAQLNPVTYTWKADGSDGQGFIAHELQAVVPDCVTGDKDAVDADGNPVYQGIDTSFLVATLTKAIQEQQAQIETLTAKVAALEAK